MFVKAMESEKKDIIVSTRVLKLKKTKDIRVNIQPHVTTLSHE